MAAAAERAIEPSSPANQMVMASPAKQMMLPP
jgi:hypothetical protein